MTLNDIKRRKKANVDGRMDGPTDIELCSTRLKMFLVPGISVCDSSMEIIFAKTDQSFSTGEFLRNHNFIFANK